MNKIAELIFDTYWELAYTTPKDFGGKELYDAFYVISNVKYRGWNPKEITPEAIRDMLTFVETRDFWDSYLTPETLKKVVMAYAYDVCYMVCEKYDGIERRIA